MTDGFHTKLLFEGQMLFYHEIAHPCEYRNNSGLSVFSRDIATPCESNHNMHDFQAHEMSVI